MAVMKYIEQIVLTYRYPVTEFTLVYSVPVSRLFPKLKSTTISLLAATSVQLYVLVSSIHAALWVMIYRTKRNAFP